jgi:hypothetical protein
MQDLLQSLSLAEQVTEEAVMAEPVTEVVAVMAEPVTEVVAVMAEPVTEVVAVMAEGAVIELLGVVEVAATVMDIFLPFGITA